MATGDVTYQSDSSAWAAMAVGPEMAAIVLGVANEAKDIAVGLSEDFRVTGEYIDSFEVTASVTQLNTGSGTHAVATGVLTNTSDHAAAVEWGNKHDHTPHHVLTRTLDAL